MGRLTAYRGPAQAPVVRACARVADLGEYLGELRRRSLMQKNPKDRLNGQAAIKHPWIQTLSTLHQGNPADELARHGEIVESLQSFSQAHELKRAALEVIAFQTPPAKFEELRKVHDLTSSSKFII